MEPYHPDSTGIPGSAHGGSSSALRLPVRHGFVTSLPTPANLLGLVNELPPQSIFRHRRRVLPDPHERHGHHAGGHVRVGMEATSTRQGPSSRATPNWWRGSRARQGDEPEIATPAQARDARHSQSPRSIEEEPGERRLTSSRPHERAGNQRPALAFLPAAGRLLLALPSSAEVKVFSGNIPRVSGTVGMKRHRKRYVVNMRRAQPDNLDDGGICAAHCATSQEVHMRISLSAAGRPHLFPRLLACAALLMLAMPLASCGGEAEPAPSFSDEMQQDMEATVLNLMEQASIPGAIVGGWVAEMGEGVAAFGLADIDAERAMATGDRVSPATRRPSLQPWCCSCRRGPPHLTTGWRTTCGVLRRRDNRPATPT